MADPLVYCGRWRWDAPERMTPEEAVHHEWLNDIKHQRPQINIIDQSQRTAVKLKSVNRDGANGNEYGNALLGQFISLYPKYHSCKIFIRISCSVCRLWRCKVSWLLICSIAPLHRENNCWSAQVHVWHVLSRDLTVTLTSTFTRLSVNGMNHTCLCVAITTGVIKLKRFSRYTP